MKLQFKHQSFQSDAVNAVADLFSGQENSRSTFSIMRDEKQFSFLQNEYGISNALLIDDAAMFANMQAVQKRNNLPKTDDLEGKQFCVEMETGTGKTYVYTKTIFELNKRYGFTKFIIVVPSVAIREGVHKSFEITREHFSLHYDNVPCRWFIYNSARLSDVRQFATSANIEIMIINIDAFKKAENVINQAQDKLSGQSAMRFIQDTNPIVIIDEPQSVDGTAKAKEAIASMNPLCVLRYSATHKEKINPLYRLTPVDAYQMGLVKQICVSSNQVAHGFNKPYIKLLSVSQEGGFKARVELDVKGKDGKVGRKTLTIKPNSDLFQLSGERELYDGYSVAGIDCMPGFECLEFTNTETLALGKSIGDIDESIVKRAQIRRTIEAHLDKELRYADKGIKVLSLFFIDEVKRYRLEDGDKGEYAHMFEECYAELLNQSKYAPLKERFSMPVAKAHDGYFSQDKKGNYKNTNGDTLDDYSTYNTIMKDKEWLLSFECPLRFIFSHSALKEGWDNPNIFQVCTLIEQKSTFTCRQKIGRGLRLCVNQDGERIEDPNINILHVMANESFAEFADTLQKEIEQESGMKFGVLDIGLFSGMVYTENGVEKTVSYEDAQELITHFKEKNYTDKHGRIKDTMKAALLAGKLDLPAKYEAARERLEQIISRADKRPPLRDASRDVTVRLNKQVMLSPEFLELWNAIKQKTTYRVNVDTSKLVADCVADLRGMEAIPKARLVSQTAKIDIRKAGVSHQEQGIRTVDIEDSYAVLPDVLNVIGTQTLTKRFTVRDIILHSERLQDLANNPQLFIERCVEIIKNRRHQLAVDGIRYLKLDGEEYYVQEVFDSAELIANLDKNAVAVEHSVYDYVIYDSGTVERPFAVALDNDPDVRMFFKIPPKFTVNTPIGSYNPDWAVYLERNGEKKLYFVLETKGDTNLFNLRTPEAQKILCGKRHFEALDSGVELRVAKDWREFRVTL